MFETIFDGRAASGRSFNEFLCRAEERAAASTADDPYHDYRRLNVQRMNRVLKTFVPSSDTTAVMQSITTPQLWMVITEDWCGDSSQSLPVLAVIAALSPNVTFSIIDRDIHLDIMDRYLTNGSRGIPKLVVFDANGNELWMWGPRPQVAQNLFVEQRQAGIEKETIYAAMHAWYAKDGGRTVEQEIREAVLESVGAGS
jgi:hypothetical protein